MIYFSIFLSIIMLSIMQYCIFYSIKKPKIINTYLHLPKTSYIPLVIFITFTIIYYIFLGFFLKQTTLPQTNLHLLTDEKVARSFSTGAQTTNEKVKQLEHEELPKEENYYYLYLSSDTSQKNLEKIALYLKKNLCKKPCTINFYDNIYAYILDRSRTLITSDANMKLWNDANYIFVANHYLGYLPFNQTSFTYFPFKDQYYSKLLEK